MKRVLVRYKVKPDRVAENEALCRAVYDELKGKAPTGIRYMTFKLEDGVSFVHVASIETDDGSNPMAGIDAFKAFQKDIGARCDEPPTATELTAEVGSYGFFD